MPDLLSHLWAWLAEILAGEPAGFGPSIVTWTGLQAWAALTGRQPEPWECEALVRLGILRANILGEETDAGRDQGRAPG